MGFDEQLIRRVIRLVDTSEYKEQPAASDIHVTPDGRFLYGAERKTSMLIGYKIDPDKASRPKRRHAALRSTVRRSRSIRRSR